jgi:branched-chain amino acid aminotransferase
MPSTPPTAPRYGWLDGRLVPWDRCVLHVRVPGAFWGANVFEGVRAYWQPTERQLTAFRLADHLARLRRSMHCLNMTIAYEDAELTEACRDLLRANEFAQDVHIVIVGYFGLGETFDPISHADVTGVHITAVPAPHAPGGGVGLAVGVSSWRRIGDDTMPPRIKTGANYHNSRLAHHEAVRNGFDTALLLNQRGTLAESPGSCLVVIRDGELVTPPGTSGVLDGITVATVAQIAERELGLVLRRREVDRTELYMADEAFLCGTLHEVLPVTSVDRIPIGAGVPGPITEMLQAGYRRAVHGDAAYRAFATPMLAPVGDGIMTTLTTLPDGSGSPAPVIAPTGRR